MNNLLIIFMFFFSCEKESNLKPLQEDVYVYEASPKIYGQSIIGFVIVQDNVVKQILNYKIYFSDKKGIIKINKKDYPSNHTYTYKKDGKGNIIIEGLNIQAYTSESYVKHKFNKDKLYKAIHPNFLTSSNQQKMKILNEY
ncbi:MULTISPECIES: hypothetical protein [Flavobacterium]|uniref:Uncharacterized protein n=1 Tax=Flavobacterium supellecticarium TaxID=2565924 RepID=A0A4V3W808_9FLAO|nr:hypothetical protein [Flavobacterium supellecticarium]THF49393.1 hypothetical protein E6C50_11620 [Flavobacterium supellecticarium]HRB71612.1 hypothetical protein [Flavobacterium sp.]